MLGSLMLTEAVFLLLARHLAHRLCAIEVQLNGLVSSEWSNLVVGAPENLIVSRVSIQRRQVQSQLAVQ
jgi:hypothetical protein